MGNTNCIADGGCPHRADITIVNNTKYDLTLDDDIPCGRECNHKGNFKYLLTNFKSQSIGH